MRQVIHCVGGVITPPCGVPSTGGRREPLACLEHPLPFSQPKIMSLAGNDPMAS